MSVSKLLLIIIAVSIVIVIGLVILIIVLTSRNGRKNIQGDSGRRSYDPARVVPVIRSSICTGEKVAGFRDLQTGHVEEVMLIKNEKDLQQFGPEYGITGNIEVIY
jgi:hypothetical protein